MIYHKYTFTGIPDEETAEILLAELAELGFDSFSDYDLEARTLQGWIPDNEHSVRHPEINGFLTSRAVSFVSAEIPDDTNWNSVWESGITPIRIGGCCIRAPFHAVPAEVLHDIVIMPKMSFGTGHHATTSLMVEGILESDLKGKTVLDMGSGTGVLAILAVRCGAVHADAIDIDRWAYENCGENIRENGVEANVNVLLGGAETIPAGKKYDTVLANINRNILLRDMGRYAAALHNGGEILLSGFLEIDRPAVEDKAGLCGLSTVEVRNRDGWLMIRCQKRADL